MVKRYPCGPTVAEVELFLFFINVPVTNWAISRKYPYPYHSRLFGNTKGMGFFGLVCLVCFQAKHCLFNFADRGDLVIMGVFLFHPSVMLMTI